jgi:uncharacterized protein
LSEHRELRFDAGAGEVSALLRRPPGAGALFVCGHGAGAGMRHPFLAAVAEGLAARGVATLRYQFPYMEAGSRRPDARAVLLAAVAAADRAAAEAAPDLPRLAGGKSMGGRMASHAAAEGLLPEARGLVFLGFPLHPAGRPGTERAAHLPRVPVPMLFLQGTRDKLAELDLLRPVLAPLGERATLHVVDGADHSFAVLKRSGRSGEEVLDELAEPAADWVRRVAAG